MKLLYSNELIKEKISNLGNQISKDYQGKDILMLGFLKGCIVFMSHLLVEVEGDLKIELMGVSSYGKKTESGELVVTKDLDADVTGRDVLIVEDIIDTGKTVAFVREYLLARGAKSVEIAVFIDKEARREFNVLKPKYSCFDYKGDDFVIGFGFDYGEKFRNLKDIYTMEDSDFEEVGEK